MHTHTHTHTDVQLWHWLFPYFQFQNATRYTPPDVVLKCNPHTPFSLTRLPACHTDISLIQSRIRQDPFFSHALNSISQYVLTHLHDAHKLTSADRTLASTYVRRRWTTEGVTDIFVVRCGIQEYLTQTTSNANKGRDPYMR